ncbi:hypothetical protein [Rhizobium ruizarguesonis]|jgi:hypothetical protein|uniref:hypothetical protein n=1 Tax=Rhizobium ruizarguesonis TaxID=2081791 RepID=UPI0010321906|nr:hypothetical protein [Rhizobium ruizarguesonis]TBC78002.1 hypothetical protein ELH30_08515 [Rhizobium ruizarguesonis]
MSAFISARFQDSVQLFADGAAYDHSGAVTSFEDKIRASRRAPVAVAVRGASGKALRHADMICDFADEFGVEVLIDGLLGQYDTSLKARRFFKGDDEAGFDFAIALWHPQRGPMHYRLHSYHGIPAFAPFVLHELGDVVACGAVFDPQTLFQLGLLPVVGDPTAWARTKGVEIMELMRGRLGEPLPGDTIAKAYRIGGHVDLATVTAAGVKLRRVRLWNDKIGELIDPYKQQAAIGSRKERRAAKRRAA